MKKLIIPISMLFVAGLYHAQATNTENYVQTRVYLEPVTSSSTTAKQIQTVQYFDGLGRPKQVVNVKASPTGKDIVSHVEYDQFGRQVKDYLPLPQSGTQTGGIYTSPLSNALTQYGSEKIYAEKLLEKSPLDRIQQQIQVGTAWANKPVQFGYDTNINGEVKKYTTTTVWENGATKSGVSDGGSYSQGQLYKNTVTDEDGNSTIELKNTRGQTVLVRKAVSASENADTYYVYNKYNQLALVVPPLAVVGTVDQTALDNLCYQYRYDGENRLVEKKLPGKGWEYMVYDKQNRLVASKNSQNQWIFSKYDKFGRVIYTGLADLGTRTTAQNALDNLSGAAASNNEERSTSPFSNSGMDVLYTNTAFPTVFTKILSVNYYDSYPSYSFNPAFPSTIYGKTILTDNAATLGKSTKSLPVMTLVKNIEDDNWTKSYSYYDTKGRPIGSHSINHLGGYTKTESELDFAGAVLQNKTYHKRLATDTEKVITETFTYDYQNRLKVHKHKINNNTEEILAQNEYNELSQLKNKKVGGTALATPLQTVDYAYNIRGWMTNINDPANLGNDLFGYKMKYNEREGLEAPDALDTNLKVLPKFNGNIAEVDWKTATNPNDNLRRYGYVYDGLNRLKAGFYQNEVNPAAKEYFEKMTYDLNGNIKTLKRSEGILLGSATAMTIDNLDYNYIGNRLNTVTDLSGQYNGYPDTSGITIPYDLNGNMTAHEDKGILQIDYNYLNLSNYIKFNDFIPSRKGDRYVNTTHIYRADGTKLRKVHDYKDSTNLQMATKTTDYLDGFQYEYDYTPLSGIPSYNFQLNFMVTSEGYFDFVKNKYIYNYTDHLGNVRLSYLYNGSSIEVLEENNYYPFGLKHEGYNPLAGNPSYQYKYNGKELQETGMYDYGARFYMPDIGRWGVLDNYSENYFPISPYSYVANNPAKFVDINGEWIYINDQNGTQYRYHNGATQNQVDGKWTNVDANTQLSDYVIQTVAGLNHLDKNTSLGNEMIGYFDQAQGKDGKVRDIYFNYTSGGSQIKYGISNIIELNTSSAKGVLTTSGNDAKYSPLYTTIAHEMGHIYENYALGVNSQADTRFGPNSTTAEIYGTHVENIVRAESGLPLRTHYGKIIDGAGNVFPSKASRLIDNAGSSIYYNSNGGQISPTPSVQSVLNVNSTILQNRYNYNGAAIYYHLQKFKNRSR